MANTTFNGAVRSENGFKQITKNASSGAITENLVIDSSGNVTTTGDITVDDQFFVKDGAHLKFTASSTVAGPTNVIVGKDGALGIVADPFTESATALFPLGSKLIYGDRTFRYAFTNGAVTAGKLLQTAAAVANHRDIAVQAAASAGDTAVTVTLGSTAATLNQYADGYLHINDVAGQGQLLKIASHPAADASANLVVTLYDAVTTALTTSSKADLIENPYANVIVAPTAETGAVAGVTTIDTADNRFFWAQTSGPCSVLTDGTIVLGHTVQRSDNLAGSVEAKADASLLENVGACMVVNGNTDNSVIMLNIE